MTKIQIFPLKSLQLGSVALIMAVVAVLTITSIAWATWTSPVSSDDTGDGHGTSHWSKVEYTTSGVPKKHHIDRIWFGGRKPDPSPSQFEQWRHHKAKYYGYDPDDGYVHKSSVSEGDYLFTGTPGLDYYYIENDVDTCCQFAMVKQKLQYKYWLPLGDEGDWIEYFGVYHRHEF